MADQWIRYFSVTDPRRHTKGFTVYKVTSTVFPRNSPEAKTEVVVWKRFKEFQRLYKDLKTRHEKLHLKDQFPLFCKPRLFGRFKSNVVEERRLAAQTLLDFTANHPPLFTSQPCVSFFEKSHKVSLSEEQKESCSQENLNTPPDISPCPTRECGLLDTVSQSSSHSTLTETDSATSLSSPLHGMQEGPFNTKFSSAFEEDSCNTPSVQSCSESTNERENPYSSSEEQTTQNFANSVIMTSSETRMPLQLHSEGKSQASPSKAISKTSSLCVAKEESSQLSFASHCSRDHCQSIAMDYITQAGYHIGQAVESETNSQFELAFSSYKAAISCLLSGVQDESSEDRKVLIQRKASQYLLRAEHIYHKYLYSSHSTTRSIPEVTNLPLISDAVGVHNCNSLEAPVADLKIYKVLGVVSTVILALNTKNNSPYIVKVLHKSPCPIDRRTKSIVPCNVPFMCQLYNFVENESAVFLVLEQARGGRLWDHIGPYFELNNSPGSARKPFSEFLTDCGAEDTKDLPNSLHLSGKVSLDKPPQSDLLIGESQTEALSASLNGSPFKLLSPVNITSRNSGCDNIPDVIAQDTQLSSECRSPSICSPEADILQSVVTSIHSETENILKNSQKLLDSVNKTLHKSEQVTKSVNQTDILDVADHLGQHGDVPVRTSSNAEHTSKNTNSNCSSKDRLTSVTKESKRSTSRDRRSTPRRSRSRIRFSCDDMFEGRARALSRSLDREALHKSDLRANQSCVGLPVDTVRLWAAQLLLALDALHRWGVIIGDMRPDNLLLGCSLNLILTYQCQWVSVDHAIHLEAIEQFYAAPEMGNIQMKTVAADWWSYGAILFELLSGETLYSCHPGGLHSYSTLHIPQNVCEEGASLLRQLLRFEPQSRLGVGPHGVARLKAHSFFRNIEWNKVLLMSVSA